MRGKVTGIKNPIVDVCGNRERTVQNHVVVVNAAVARLHEENIMTKLIEVGV